MVSKRRRLMAILLSVMMLLGTMIVATASASAAGETVYCENAAGWGEVYCYMWNSDSDKNAQWPGVKMTKGDGNLWSYTVSNGWGNIIFNGGEGQAQSDDLSYPANGNCYNNSSKSWSTVQGSDTPDTPTNPVTPDDPVIKPNPSDKITVYCRNTANWSKVNVYMWNSDSDKNAEWPGAPAKNMGDGVWLYEASKNYANVIFNDGSTQTDDLTFKGADYIFDNSTIQWELYDTSKLHIKSFTADAVSPQYTGVKINLKAEAAGGEGQLSYQFTVGNTVISAYGSSSSVSWTPASAGNFTVKVDVKDTAGATVSKSMTFEIKDIATEVKPVIQNVEVTPSNFENTEIKKGAETTVDVTAGGGNTGTKLLFYKYTITDPKGDTANVPYYTLKNEYKFTPASTGTYSVTTTVQGSDNSITVKTVEYDCVDEFSKPGQLSASLSAKEAGDGKYTATVNAAGGTAPYTYEFKLNGETVQAYSNKNTYTFDATKAGNYTVEVTVKDAEGNTVTKSTSVQVSDGSDVVPKPPVNPAKINVALIAESQGNSVYKFTANATGGEGSFQYEFSANGTVVRPYSDSNSVALDLSADGIYTIKVTVKDEVGTTATAEKTFTVSGGVVIMPLEVTVDITTDAEGYLVAKATATGGKGDYQYEFLINGTVYQKYSTNDSFRFGLPTDVDANYKVTVNVKDAAGTAVVGNAFAWVKDGKVGFGAELPGGESTLDQADPDPTPPAGNYLKGDADCNGKVNVKDATLIQKYIAKMADMTAEGLVNAEVDGNDKLNVKDATMIQKFIANLVKW